MWKDFQIFHSKQDMQEGIRRKIHTFSSCLKNQFQSLKVHYLICER